MGAPLVIGTENFPDGKDNEKQTKKGDENGTRIKNEKQTKNGEENGTSINKNDEKQNKKGGSSEVENSTTSNNKNMCSIESLPYHTCGRYH